MVQIIFGHLPLSSESLLPYPTAEDFTHDVTGSIGSAARAETEC